LLLPVLGLGLWLTRYVKRLGDIIIQLAVSSWTAMALNKSVARGSVRTIRCLLMAVGARSLVLSREMPVLISFMAHANALLQPLEGPIVLEGMLVVQRAKHVKGKKSPVVLLTLPVDHAQLAKAVMPRGYVPVPMA